MTALSADDDVRLARLVAETARLAGRPAALPQDTLSTLGLDSRHLVGLMLATDVIYEFEVPFEALDLTNDLSLRDLHRSILALLPTLADETPTVR